MRSSLPSVACSWRASSAITSSSLRRRSSAGSGSCWPDSVTSLANSAAGPYAGGFGAFGPLNEMLKSSAPAPVTSLMPTCTPPGNAVSALISAAIFWSSDGNCTSPPSTACAPVNTAAGADLWA